MSDYRLVLDALGFYTQVPIEEPEPEPEPPPSPEAVLDDLFATVCAKPRGRPRKCSSQ